jgi:hypothetical protein
MIQSSIAKPVPGPPYSGPGVNYAETLAGAEIANPLKIATNGQTAPAQNTQVEIGGPSGFQCLVCTDSFLDNAYLVCHAETYQHATLVCRIPGCRQAFSTWAQCIRHEADPHITEHHRVPDPDGLACSECSEVFTTKQGLHNHSIARQHSPYACSCGAKFAREDTLNRHFISLNEDSPKFPCNFCKRHGGKSGFRRRDHLVQHLQGYHKFDTEKVDRACPRKGIQSRRFLLCPHVGCEASREASFHSLTLQEKVTLRPFKSKAEYSRHMKDVHAESPFPCSISGCARVGSKGYTREKDLMKHYADKHPEATQYAAEPRQVRYNCEYGGCHASYRSASGLSDHMLFKHRF